jgi:Mn2+/Fe2+ NRAMP family transporter
VLAGSAAYALAESQGWKSSLDNKPREAVGFYSVIAAATLLGIGIDLTGFDPIKALFWSAVINGFVAVPVMAAMMYLGSQRTEMGDYTLTKGPLILGWIATALMAAAAVAMIIL